VVSGPSSLKYRMSPFANSRTRRDDSNNKITGGEKDRWLVVFELMTSRLSLHGFMVFEVAWRDVQQHLRVQLPERADDEPAVAARVPGVRGGVARRAEASSSSTTCRRRSTAAAPSTCPCSRTSGTTSSPRYIYSTVLASRFLRRDNTAFFHSILLLTPARCKCCVDLPGDPRHTQWRTGVLRSLQQAQAQVHYILLVYSTALLPNSRPNSVPHLHDTAILPACSIYNHVQTRLRHMLRAAGLARPSCRCKTAKRRLGQGREVIMHGREETSARSSKVS
jgi:hypothetical protein